MKYFILIGYLLIVSIAHGQQIINGKFEDYDLTTSCLQSITTSDLVSTGIQFQNGCLNGVWKVSHGTPEIRSAGDPTNPRHNQYALLWTGRWYGSSYPIRGEGIYYDCNFFQGQVYKISLRIFTVGTLDKIVIGLANSLSNNTTGSLTVDDGTYDYPTEIPFNITPDLFNFSYPKSSGWYTIEREFIPDQNYEHLWIYAYDDVNTYTVLFVDDVSFTSCIPNKNYTNMVSLPRITKTVDYIVSGTNTTVSSGEDVTFQAGNYITLLPGFRASAGSKFTARIAPCSEESCDIIYSRKGFEDNINSFENLENLLSIYPNPAEDEVTVKFPFEFNKDIKVILLDVFGKIVTESNILMDGDEFKVDLQGMKKGMYFIKVDVEGRSIVKRIIVN